MFDYLLTHNKDSLSGVEGCVTIYLFNKIIRSHQQRYTIQDSKLPSEPGKYETKDSLEQARLKLEVMEGENILERSYRK